VSATQHLETGEALHEAAVDLGNGGIILDDQDLDHYTSLGM
jgi:hypothetical protein